MRQQCVHVSPSITVDQEPELSGSVAEYRERLVRDRRQSQRRYRDHLAAVFARRRVADAGELADVALEALTVWRYIDSGEQCRCSCHPRLPDTDLHDYGFDCGCSRTPEERRRVFQQWRDDLKAFWQSPDGQQIKAVEHAGEVELGLARGPARGRCPQPRRPVS
jgi:hypothetical protein